MVSGDEIAVSGYFAIETVLSLTVFLDEENL